jgi:hypothetical protein
MATLKITSDYWEGQDFWVLARVTGPDGILLSQGSFAGAADDWTLNVYDRTTGTPGTVVYTTSGAASAIIFNTLQTDGYWTVDAEGYNMRHRVDAAQFTNTGGHSYTLEYELDTVPWDTVWVVADVKARAVAST